MSWQITACYPASRSLKALPRSERPRERLLQHGADALSLAELVAIVLGTGIKEKSVLEVAQEMITHFGGLFGLLEASVAELMEIKGVGKAKAIQLKAVFGIALKSMKPSQETKHLIQTAAQAFAYIRHEVAQYKQEVFLALLKDAKGYAMRCEKIAMGTLSEVLVHPREVFYPAIKHKAQSMVIAHNHPSGDPTPSRADIQLTRLLLQCSRVVGIAIDDHLIIGKDKFVSLKTINDKR